MEVVMEKPGKIKKFVDLNTKYFKLKIDDVPNLQLVL